MSKAKQSTEDIEDVEVLEVEEVKEAKEATPTPTLDDSPLMGEVIDRSELEQKTTSKTFGLNNISSDDSDLFEELKKENKSKKDVPTPSSKEESEGESEESEPITPKQKKFSTKHIIGIIDNVLPKATSYFVALPEGEIRKAESEGKYQKGTAQAVANKNTQDTKKLKDTVQEWSPLLEEPLSEFMQERDLNLSPGVALGVYGILMLIMLSMTAAQIRRDNKYFLDEIRKLQNNNQQANSQSNNQSNQNTNQNENTQSDN